MGFYGNQTVIKSDEYINDLLPKEMAPQPPKIKYVSGYAKQTREELKRNRYPYKTMGPPEVSLPSTTQYLRKHANDFDYGQVPKYLYNRKQEEEERKAGGIRSAQNKAEDNSLHTLSSHEQKSILKGLTANWEEVYRQYLGLSVIIDTIPKRLRKERLESEMESLQKDIELFSRYKTVYIAD
ncbi:enkurin-like [Octopus sinensis]|uniref:Enkurin-like n=1 Tax=Octopus sinensis TaxID=2607531 RepID=A0A7E6ELH4_9MOLL|nr:enkurin-like [Octopus sinensis]